MIFSSYHLKFLFANLIVFSNSQNQFVNSYQLHDNQHEHYRNMTNNTTQDLSAETPNLQHITYFKISGTVALTEFIVGTSLNSVCFFYFLRKNLTGVGHTAVNSLFLAISFVDICFCSNMLLSAISALNGGAEMGFRSKFLCNFWGLVWHTGQGLAIFLVALLAFARWRCMTQPLKKMKRRTVVLAILAYTLFQIFKATMNYWYVGKSYEYRKRFLGCTVSNINVNRLGAEDKAVYVFLYIFEVLVPAIAIIAFSVSTMVCLKRSSKGLSGLASQNDRGWKKKRDAAVTVLILVATYLFFNVFYWFFLIGDAIYVFSERNVKYHVEIWGLENLETYFLTYYGIYTHAIVLNSTANPIIYIVRLEGLRAFVREMILRLMSNLKKLCGVQRECARVDSCSYTLVDRYPLYGHSRLTYCSSRESGRTLV